MNCSSHENLFNPCHGHGACVMVAPDSYGCVCDDGWSGHSDWHDNEGLDCQIYEPAVLGLWIFQLALISVAGITGWPRMYTLIQRFLITKRRMQASGKKYGIRHNRALLSMLVYWAGCWPCHVMLCVCKVAFPQLKIGVDWVPTVLWLAERCFFYLVGYLFQPALIKSLLNGRKDAISYLNSTRLSNTWRLITMTIIASGLLVIPTLFLQQDGGTQVTLVIFNLIMVACLIAMGVYAQSVKKHISAILMDSYKTLNDEKILTVKANLEEIQNEITRQTFVQMPIFILFGCWPFLWAKQDYLYPVSISVMPIIGFRGIHSLMKNSSADRGLKSDAGSSMKNSQATLSTDEQVVSMKI